MYLKQLGRRQLLTAAASALVVSVLGWTGIARGRGAPSANEPERDLVADLFRDRRAALEVGRRYLADEPSDADRDILLAAIPEAVPNGQPDPLRLAIGRRRERDFREGDVVIIGGWVLARTEARLCALLALG